MATHTGEWLTAQAPTLTGLHSLAASNSPLWLSGWTSDSIEFIGVNYLDFLVSGSFTTAATNRQVGDIKVYAYFPVNPDTPTWPLLFSSGSPASVGLATLRGAEQRESGLVLLKSISVDAEVSDIYPFGPVSVAQAAGSLVVPKRFAIFITHNIATGTSAGLAGSGSVLYVQPYRVQTT